VPHNDEDSQDDSQQDPAEMRASLGRLAL
jgi:hypothetical protein